MQILLVKWPLWFMTIGWLAAASWAGETVEPATTVLKATAMDGPPAAVESSNILGTADFLVNFGTREVGRIIRVGLGYSSVGGTAITVTEVGEITGPGAEAFEIFSEACTGLTLAPGEQCLIEVDFSPPSMGDFEAQFVVTSTAVNSPETVLLIGRGIVDRLFEDRFEAGEPTTLGRAP